MTIKVNVYRNVLMEYEPASIGTRILATFFDYVLFLLWALLTWGLPALLGYWFSAWYYIIVLALPMVVYDFICEVFFEGQSLGKRAVGIRVINVDGTEPSVQSYFFRWVTRILDTKILGGLIAVTCIAATLRCQRVGDMLAGTTVIDLNAKTPYADRVHQPPAPPYHMRFPEVKQLAERDVRIIRDVLDRGTEEAILRTSNQVKNVLGIKSPLSAWAFLETVISDYEHLPLLKEEEEK